MAVKMRAALQEAVGVVDALLGQIDAMKPTSSNADGGLRNAVAEAHRLKSDIAKLLAQKPKAKKRKLVLRG